MRQGQQSAHRGASSNAADPQAHRASGYATRAGTRCRMSLSDGGRYPAGGVAPCADPGGSAKRPRGLPGLWSEPDVRCSAVKWSGTGPKARAAFLASPWMSVGKGGLQGGNASPPRTKPVRRAWNGQPGFATAKCAWVGADAILTHVKTAGPYRLLTTPALATICRVEARFSGFPAGPLRNGFD